MSLLCVVSALVRSHHDTMPQPIVCSALVSVYCVYCARTQLS